MQCGTNIIIAVPKAHRAAVSALTAVQIHSCLCGGQPKAQKAAVDKEESPTSDYGNSVNIRAELLIIALIIFRCLSKNIPQRTKENEIFLNICERAMPFLRKIPPFFRRVADWFKLQHRKFKDRKTHRYIKCPYCKAVLRVPFRKGKHSLKCPKCHEFVKANIRF